MPLHLALNGETHSIEIVRRKPHLVLSVNGRTYEIQKWSTEPVSEMMLGSDAVAVARAGCAAQRPPSRCAEEGRRNLRQG